MWFFQTCKNSARSNTIPHTHPNRCKELESIPGLCNGTGDGLRPGRSKFKCHSWSCFPVTLNFLKASWVTFLASLFYDVSHFVNHSCLKLYVHIRHNYTIIWGYLKICISGDTTTHWMIHCLPNPGPPIPVIRYAIVFLGHTVPPTLKPILCVDAYQKAKHLLVSLKECWRTLYNHKWTVLWKEVYFKCFKRSLAHSISLD